MIRVIVDANVYLSYIGAKDSSAHLVIAIDSAISSRNVDLLVPPGVIQEVRRIAQTKEYFRCKISPSVLEHGINILLESGIELPRVEVTQSYCRDPKDDYMIESALQFNAAYLVTGDKDLLDLGGVAGVDIIPPEELYWLMDAFDLLIGQKHHFPSRT